ncbi:hypothetical protein T01_8559 [Trichinella spiralis]|uniref:Uncharacterized protein n=1 Tax=Trichinella spiralis TaxID=6334 RepID=A0A0V1BVW2_TRISP|nr:hypothetical protein T01_8559 [Trichinella spiralis]
MYATVNFDTKNCVLFGMYSELVCAMENVSLKTSDHFGEMSFSTEYQYPAILIRLTRSTTAAAYDGKVTFKLDKLVFYIDRSNKSADVWLALFSNQPIRQLHSEQR